MMFITELVQKEIAPEDTVLDVSCGECSITKDIIAKVKVGIDINRPYLEIAEKYCIPLNFNVKEIQNFIIPKSFDIVLWLDGIEHLETNEALKVLEYLEIIAKRKIIIFTPNDFVINDNYLNESKEVQEFQRHKSCFKSDFWERRGYRIRFSRNKTQGFNTVLAVKEW